MTDDLNAGASGEPGPKWAARLFRQTSDLALIELDASGTISGWYGACERLFGYAQNVALGQPFALISPDNARSTFNQLLRPSGSGAGGSSSASLQMFRHRDGSTFSADISILPIQGAAGEVLGHCAVLAPFAGSAGGAGMGAGAGSASAMVAAPANAAPALPHQSLSKVAHDIRNPLGAITNAAFLLSKSTDETTRAKASDVLGRQVGVLKKLADDLSAMARET